MSSDATARRPLPPMLDGSPRLSRWVRFASGGVVQVRSGKVELGQGILTALAQIAAEELDVEPHRIRMVAATTDESPDEGFTAGSLSIQVSGAALRQACAEVRALFVERARQELGDGNLSVADGVISGPAGGPTTSYWALAGEVDLDRDATGEAVPKNPSAYRLIGTSTRRIDLADKLNGTPRFVQDLRLPGQLCGRVVRPPSRGAVLAAVDTAGVAAMAGVRAVVIDGSFVGVVARDEETASAAARALLRATTWDEQDTLPEQATLAEYLRTAPSEPTVLADVAVDPTVVRSDAQPRRFSAGYTRPYLAHASIGTSTAVARWESDADRLHVWTHSQGVFPLGRDIARATGVRPADVTVTHVEGAGCYGHNAADDAAYDAVLLARAVRGSPVQVVWSRQDELGWAPYGPAMRVELAADVAEDGTIERWSYDGWGNGHSSRPGTLESPSLLAFEHQEHGSPIPPAADPPLAAGAGTGRNAIPGYAIDTLRVTAHRLLDMPLRTSAMRALGAHLNVFATESFMDELALAAGVDPLEYRLRHLRDERGCAVLEAVAHAAGWGDRPLDDSCGRGLAYARYKNIGAWCAVVADIRAEQTVQVQRLTIAVDVGVVVNPDGVVNQIEGGAIQAASWTVRERVRFDRRTVRSDTWDTYPIFGFADIPAVQVIVMDSRQPSVGAGEASVGPTAGAIGNALFGALGVRVRDLPLDADNIVAAMDR